MFAQRPGAMAIAIGAALLGIGSYSLMNTYTINYGTAELGFSFQDLLIATTIGGLLQLVTIPLFGRWATRIGSARVVAWGALGTLLIAFPMYYLLQFATFPILVATMIIGGILPTMSWAALGGLMNDLFPDHFRYSALSFAYAIAATVSGFVPIVTLRARRRDGLRVVAPRHRAGRAVGDHAGVGVGRRAPARRARVHAGTGLDPGRCAGSLTGWRVARRVWPHPGCRRPTFLASLADGPPPSRGGDHFQVRWTTLPAMTDAAHAEITECELVDASVGPARPDRGDPRRCRHLRSPGDGDRGPRRAASAGPHHRRADRHARSRRRRSGRSGAARHPDRLSVARRRAGDGPAVITDCTIGSLDVPQARLTRVAFHDSRADEVDTRGLRAEHLDLRGLEALSFLDPPVAARRDPVGRGRSSASRPRSRRRSASASR